MRLRHILAATDESDAGRHAVRTAMALALRASARITVMQVIAADGANRRGAIGLAPSGKRGPAALEHLRQWLQADVLTPGEAEQVELGVSYGIPGIEICRFAEDIHADLLVLGRKRHSQMMRLLLGDTADAVARRSRIPCLFVPPESGGLNRVLAALDGSERGTAVLDEACDFARYAGAKLEAVTVEQSPANEPLHLVTTLPMARSSSLQTRLRDALARARLPDAPLVIRRGDVLERIVAEAQETEADVLAIGYHRGGPPGVLEAGSTARRLAHVAPCAVLTIPL